MANLKKGNFMISVNINKKVKIVLTKDGKEIYGQYLNQFAHIKCVNQEIPEELTLPLWEFCQIFGNHLYMGNTKGPFTENNAIFIDLSDDCI